MTTSRRTTRRPWVRWSDERLLNVRLCDLGLKIEGTDLQPRVERLYEELAERDIRLRPHVWLSSEWFSPDGIPGIAIPFYLAHDRLIRLEKKMMLGGVDGAGDTQCMRLLRHEAGHCVCTAYRLHYRPIWRETFGSFTQPYPQSYQPKPNSRDFVLHLDWWYAQAHPAEDFAETFAVWLRPHNRWKRLYEGWPAMRKLQRVDQMMQDIARATPPIRQRKLIEPLSEIRMTLGEHYHRKRKQYAQEWPEFFDRDLRKLFTDDPARARGESAAAFFRRERSHIRALVAHWTGVAPYTIEQVLRDMIDRCKELKLRLAHSPARTRTHAMLMITVQTMHHLHRGNYRYAL